MTAQDTTSAPPDRAATGSPGRRSRDLLLGAGLVVCWSSGFIGAELAAPHAPPATTLAWRYLLTTVLLTPWLVRAARTWGPRLRPADVLRQVALALLSQVGYLAGVFAAVSAGVPAGTTALVAALQPALVVLLVALTSRRAVGSRRLVGLVVGTAGVAVVVSGDLRAGAFGGAAVLLPVAATASLAVGTVLQRRWPAPGGPLTTLAAHSAVSAVAFTAWALATGALVPPPVPGFAGAVLWSALLAGIGGYGTYVAVVRRSGPARASTLLWLTPPVTALWAWAVFGDPLRPATLVGLAVCAAAVVVFGPAREEGAVSTPRR
ncbi:DMT family transporter [Kineococcus terrestris]|uniref:DMT family transporter n=1 Tax=Kineococcus terrestris TaxID=2044856 RepID=UPI0034DB6D3E